MTTNNTARRAGIYVRVSTERQAEKVSPQEQEKACRALCEANGYFVAEVYRDTEKYRVGKKMVEPSGPRADRPQLKRLLADADAKRLDVIVAWKEDRLYRGIRPMLPVIECLERNKITIELVTETFDAKMAPIKAAIARMEIEGIKERILLGRAAILAEGKPWSGGSRPYGYTVGDDKRMAIEPVEAGWVVKILQWYAGGMTISDIRRQLILGGAPQRTRSDGGKSKVKVDWAHVIVQRITCYEPYWTGKQIVKMAGGQTFEIPVPIIIDADLAARVKARREKVKAHPAHHKKYRYLVDGLAYCDGCGVKLQAKSRIRPWGVELGYICAYNKFGYVTGKGADCCKYISVSRLDAQVWEMVWDFISDDAIFQARLNAKIEALQAAETDAEASLDKLQTALDDLSIERQRIITWARKGSITEADMELQLGGITIQEASLKREMADKSLLVGNRAQRLIEFANLYRERLRDGRELMTMEPATEEEAEKQFQARRNVVDAIVKRVDVRADKTPIVHFEFDLREMDGAEVLISAPWSIDIQSAWPASWVESVSWHDFSCGVGWIRANRAAPKNVL